MGCCFSNTNNNNKNPSKQSSTHITKTTKSHIAKSKSPPQLDIELEQQETVKEVLSETPSSSIKNTPPKKPHISPSSRHNSPFIRTAPLLPDFPKLISQKPHLPYPPINDDVSEETQSTHSTLSVEFHEIRHRSPAKRAPSVGRSSPVRRTAEPSPGRTRPEPGPVCRRRGCGESSGRRSKSPVTRTDSSGSGRIGNGMGRCPSGRRTGKSPGRVGSGSGDGRRRLESGDRKWPPTNNNGGNNNSNNESIENPLVSLECFIFL